MTLFLHNKAEGFSCVQLRLLAFKGCSYCCTTLLMLFYSFPLICLYIPGVIIGTGRTLVKESVLYALTNSFFLHSNSSPKSGVHTVFCAIPCQCCIYFVFSNIGGVVLMYSLNCGLFRTANINSFFSVITFTGDIKGLDKNLETLHNLQV